MYNIYICVCVYVHVQYVYVYDYVWVYLMKIKFLKMVTMVTKVGPMCFDQTPQRDAGDRQGGFFSGEWEYGHSQPGDVCR